LCGGRLLYARAAEDDDGVADTVLLKQDLRFLIIDLQVNPAGFVKLEEADILVRLTIAGAVYDGLNSMRGIRILRRGFGPVPG
jgi:hypothetical protein